MVDCMPNRISSMAIAKQIVRSGTSPAANYRAACLGKSDKDFLNKLKMVEEELDETIHWLEIIAESEMKFLLINCLGCNKRRMNCIK